MSNRLKQFGIEIPPEDMNPTVVALVRVIELLLDEIDRLKGLPELPNRQPIAPSSLEDDTKPPSQQVKARRKPRKRKRPKGHKRMRNQGLRVTKTSTLEPTVVPPEAVRIGSKSFIVQDLVLEPACIRYRRQRYRLPDGSILVAPRPEHLKSQFGGTLRSFIIYQYYHNQVTQPCLLKQLTDMGIRISAGQISRIITEDHDRFHAEKGVLLEAARASSSYFQADDTSARIQGTNGHTLAIGNDRFAYFETTHSKSRLNFLEVIRRPHTDYVFGPDAQEYFRWQRYPAKVLAQVQAKMTSRVIWPSLQAWQRQLSRWGIDRQEHRERLTEAAVWGSLQYHDLYLDQPFLTDGAKQFKLLAFEHASCWLHAERGIARLIPVNKRQRKAQEKIRDQVWRYYQKLKKYRRAPTKPKSVRLAKEFEKLFTQATYWPKLNHELAKIHANREDLLLVLSRPELPLHNNLSENDIRQFAKLRKISGSTRSEDGRKCRDTFISLKTTCRKLGVSFWHYLQDRIFGNGQIMQLGDLMQQAANS